MGSHTIASLLSTIVQHFRLTMAELGLKKKEVDAIEFAFDVYDFKGDGKVDAFYAGDLIRACNLNPTLKTIEEIGGQEEKGKKMLSKDDVFPMYKACKDSKDQGGFHDFVEILKLYDKNDDNTMIGNELFRLLTNLGEKLTKEEAKGLMKELVNQRMKMASCPSSPSLRECAPLKSKFSQARLLRVNTGLQPWTSHIFGESDEPNSQEISRFIKITFRDRGRSIFCKIDFSRNADIDIGGVTEATRNSSGRKTTSRNNHRFPLPCGPSEVVISLLLLRTLTTASFLSIFGQNCSQNNF